MGVPCPKRRELRVDLFTTRDVERDLVGACSSALRGAFGASIKEVTTFEELPRNCFNPFRAQYVGTCLVKWLSRMGVGRGIKLGLLNVDAYVPGLNFIFGLADPHLKVATIYIPRLRWGASRARLVLRAVKESLHEVGHVLGLGHCSIRECVMSFSNSVYDVDYKRAAFCDNCRSVLRENCIEVGPEYALSRGRG